MPGDKFGVHAGRLRHRLVRRHAGRQAQTGAVGSVQLGLRASGAGETIASLGGTGGDDAIKQDSELTRRRLREWRSQAVTLVMV